jgi:glycosyltransferase involved in cell wall biosynthesis
VSSGTDFDSRIVFFDPVCPIPYSKASLDGGGLGGSEACVVRVAEELDACVVQHCRDTAEGRYRPPFASADVEHAVVSRDARALPEVRRRFPNARLYVWLHDLAAPGSTRAKWLTRTQSSLDGVTLICVSDFLHARIAAVVDELDSPDAVSIRTIFNPIADDLLPSGEAIDENKLIFLSSPNKGLSYALTAFQAMREAMPGLRLFVANPGYRELQVREIPGVFWLGKLPNAQAITHARSAFAVFMPNLLLPETFGLVYAEANAVGTPVLAHDVGAAREVLHAANPVLPVRARQRVCARVTREFGARAPHWLSGAAQSLGVFDDYIATLRAWRAGQRPTVVGNPRFRLSEVVREWRRLLA